MVVTRIGSALPSRTARMYPRTAVRYTCSATLSGSRMPISHHPERLTRLRWPTSYRYFPIASISMFTLLEENTTVVHFLCCYFSLHYIHESHCFSSTIGNWFLMISTSIMH